MCCNNKKDNLSISISGYGLEITNNFNFSDPTIEDWFNAFKGLLVGIGFSENQVDDFVMDYADEINDAQSQAIGNSLIKILNQRI